jgi:hypothetical protein
MKLFRIWIYFLFLLVLAPNLMAAKKKIRYPLIQSVQGSATLVDDSVKIINREAQHSEKTKNLKSGSNLKDKAWLRTGERSELQIALSKEATLILESETEVLIPAINWQDGDVREIRVLKGQIRVLCQTGCDRNFVTGISNTVLPPGDFLLSYNPKGPAVSLAVLTGEVSFRGLENENSVLLKAGESAQFVGVMENDELAFDILLKGRKVAKGRLENVTKISAEELATYQKKDDSRKKSLKKAPKVQRKSSQICDKPLGELNQCAWSCEDNPKNAKTCAVNQGAHCVRTRCNANGQWAEKEILPASQQTKCGLKAIVDSCDY